MAVEGSSSRFAAAGCSAAVPPTRRPRRSTGTLVNNPARIPSFLVNGLKRQENAMILHTLATDLRRALVGLATAALAGPPLLCHPFEIGPATSLPWNPRATVARHTRRLRPIAIEWRRARPVDTHDAGGRSHGDPAARGALCHATTTRARDCSTRCGPAPQRQRRWTCRVRRRLSDRDLQGARRCRPVRGPSSAASTDTRWSRTA